MRWPLFHCLGGHLFSTFLLLFPFLFLPFFFLAYGMFGIYIHIHFGQYYMTVYALRTSRKTRGQWTRSNGG
ncbi:hypothetical protein M752DRAFT_61395 [Aspergillus phoenicis ATCC 13157]|uniref:Uncharacterized protein n=1 Tax=Aspergillus phoenicis ATCC 13157 TaxID=1353007 RepID=A0A370PAE4_ASPPH|nr:hypothetical protein M752DRAFT_61395 [Aspergillus phoenicis ATCC 13157]